MYHKINGLLGKHLGLQINRVAKPKALPKVENPGKNNLIVEFIGPAGVGKTTLCNYYLNNNKLNTSRNILKPADINSFKKGRKLNLEGLYREIFLERV